MHFNLILPPPLVSYNLYSRRYKLISHKKKINVVTESFIVFLVRPNQSAYHYNLELYVLGPLSKVVSGWDLNTG
jgi:hypothetical protein